MEPLSNPNERLGDGECSANRQRLSQVEYFLLQLQKIQRFFLGFILLIFRHFWAASLDKSAKKGQNLKLLKTRFYNCEEKASSEKISYEFFSKQVASYSRWRRSKWLKCCTCFITPRRYSNDSQQEAKNHYEKGRRTSHENALQLNPCNEPKWDKDYQGKSTFCLMPGMNYLKTWKVC